MQNVAGNGNNQNDALTLMFEFLRKQSIEATIDYFSGFHVLNIDVDTSETNETSVLFQNIIPLKREML